MLPALAILAVLTAPTMGRSPNGRLPFIVNGKDVDIPGKYSYHASFTNMGDYGCGAVIISSKFLLTAAHCCHGDLSATIVVGAHDLKTRVEGDPRTYNIASEKKNPGYRKGTGRYEADICIITLTTDIDMTNAYVSAIALPAVGSTEDFVGKDCIITGRGQTHIGIPNILQEADSIPLSLTACKTGWANHPVFNESYIVAAHICVGAAGSDKAGACRGDSGGPLSCPSSAGGNVLAGVTSWGDPSCDPQYPSVYTRITSFRDWIKEHTGI